MIIGFTITVSTLVAGVSLKYLIKEANDEMLLLENRIKRDK